MSWKFIRHLQVETRFAIPPEDPEMWIDPGNPEMMSTAEDALPLVHGPRVGRRGVEAVIVGATIVIARKVENVKEVGAKVGSEGLVVNIVLLPTDGGTAPRESVIESIQSVEATTTKKVEIIPARHLQDHCSACRTEISQNMEIPVTTADHLILEGTVRSIDVEVADPEIQKAPAAKLILSSSSSRHWSRNWRSTALEFGKS
jgi:hypothetical protein